MIKFLSLTALLLGTFAIALAQETTPQPTEAEVAASKRSYEILRHPTGIITIRLAAYDRQLPTTPPPYRPYDRMEFLLFMTQSSGQDLVGEDDRDAFYAYRPELIRDGDIVPYTKDAQESVKRAEREPWGNGFTRAPSRLVSGQEYQDHYVNLDEWYEIPLKPGRYQLIARKQFVPGGDWIESNPVTFDVVSRQTSEPIRQSDDGQLPKIEKSLREEISKEMPEWRCHSVEPIKGSASVIIYHCELGDILVKIAVIEYQTREKAEELFKETKTELKRQEEIATKNRGTEVHFVKEEMSSVGDEGYVYDIRGSEAVAFRKGRFLVNISVPRPEPNKDLFFSRKFAEHVTKALDLDKQ